MKRGLRSFHVWLEAPSILDSWTGPQSLQTPGLLWPTIVLGPRHGVHTLATESIHTGTLTQSDGKQSFTLGSAGSVSLLAQRETRTVTVSCGSCFRTRLSFLSSCRWSCSTPEPYLVIISILQGFWVLQLSVNGWESISSQTLIQVSLSLEFQSESLRGRVV